MFVVILLRKCQEFFCGNFCRTFVCPFMLLLLLLGLFFVGIFLFTFFKYILQLFLIFCRQPLDSHLTALDSHLTALDSFLTA